jgi:hypothetical protein
MVRSDVDLKVRSKRRRRDKEVELREKGSLPQGW